MVNQIMLMHIKRDKVEEVVDQLPAIEGVFEVDTVSGESLKNWSDIVCNVQENNNLTIRDAMYNHYISGFKSSIIVDEG